MRTIETAVWDRLNQYLILELKASQSGSNCLYYVSGWDAGFNIEYTNDRSDRASDAMVRISKILLGSDDKSVTHWRKTIPRDLRENVKALPNSQMELLMLVRRYTAAYDLFVANPLLLWLYYMYGQREGLTIEALVAGLKHKQTALLRILGFAGTKANIRLLQKIKNQAPNAVQVHQVLTQTRHKGIAKYYAHALVVDGSTVSLLERYPQLASSPSKQLIPDLKVARHLKAFECVLRHRGDRVYQCRNGRQLLALYEQVLREKIERSPPDRENQNPAIDIALPPPPIPNNDFIYALSTPKEIIQEGKEMAHCIASYIPRIASHQYYAYSVLYPERATIGLRIGLDGSIKIDDVRGKSDQHASSDLLVYVQKWFSLNNEERPILN